MPELSLQDIVAEQNRRAGIPVQENYESVLERTGGEEKPTSTFQNVQDFLETSAKGGARGVLDLLTLWPEVVRQIKGEKDVPFTNDYITTKIKEATGIDLMSIPGSTGVFQFSRAATPAVAMRAAGMPLLSPAQTTKAEVAKYVTEAGLAGGTSLLADQTAPDSPLTQFLIQALPSVAVGLGQSGQTLARKPTGAMRPEAAALQEVGPLTPGEASGSRVQLAREARIEKTPEIETTAEDFRSKQAQSVRYYLENTFKMATNRVKPDVTKIYKGIKNYGKALATKLKEDAGRDFSKAEGIPSLIDAAPVVNRLKSLAASLNTDVPELAAQHKAIQRLLGRLTEPEVPEIRTPSMIVTAEGQPAFVNITPGRPEGITKMTISDLKQAISGWGEAAYSGQHPLLGDIAPGQAKGVARAILRGYKDALDVAIDANIPGANLLKTARDNFKNNLDSLRQFEKTKVVKTFGKPLEELPVEEVLKKLEKLPPSQRSLLVKFVSDEYPQVENTMRAVKLNKLLESAVIKGAPEGAPTFDVKAALKKLDEAKDDWKWLFPDKKSSARAEKALDYLRKITVKVEGEADARLPAYAAAGATGASRQLALGAQVAETVRRNIVSPQSLANIMFNPRAVNTLLALQNRSTPQKLMDFLISLEESTVRTSLRAAPGASSAEPTKEQQNYSISLEDIEKEQKRRGMTK